MCIWGGEYIISPKEVGDVLEAGTYVTADDGSHINTKVYLKGYNQSTSTWHTFGESIPNADNWAGMPLNPLYSDTVGTWTMHWDIPDVCAAQSLFSLTITDVSCDSITVDTWKPKTIEVSSGKSLPFIVHSADGNKPFRLYYEAGIPSGTRVLIEATTDSQGCYSGTLGALPDGEYTIYLCYPVVGVCAYGHSQVIVRWGTKPLDIATMILYGALGLGAAYIIGQVIAKDGRTK